MSYKLGCSAPGQRLSADTIIVTRDANPNDARAANTGETYAFSVRDRFSGKALVFPQTKKSASNNYKALKHALAKRSQNRTGTKPEQMGIEPIRAEPWNLIRDYHKKDGYESAAASGLMACRHRCLSN